MLDGLAWWHPLAAVPVGVGVGVILHLLVGGPGGMPAWYRPSPRVNPGPVPVPAGPRPIDGREEGAG